MDPIVFDLSNQLAGSETENSCGFIQFEHFRRRAAEQAEFADRFCLSAPDYENFPRYRR